MAPEGRSSLPISPVPTSGASELAEGHLRLRREELAAHNPLALTITGAVLAAMQIQEAAADMVEGAGELGAELLRSLHDGQVDAVEAGRLRTHAVRMVERSAVLEVSCAVLR